MNRARAANGRYAGVVAAVEELLSDMKPRDVNAIAEALPQFEHRQIKGAIYMLVKRRSGLVNIGKIRHAVYTFKAVKTESVPLKVREFKPLKRDPFEHMKLAMLTR